MSFEDELIALLEEFCAAFAAQDADAVKSLLDDDACFVSSGGVVLHDRRRIDAFVDDYATGSASFSFAWDSCQVAELGEGAGWVAGFGREVRLDGDATTEIPVRLTLACRRRGSGWGISHLHASTPGSSIPGS